MRARKRIRRELVGHITLCCPWRYADIAASLCPVTFDRDGDVQRRPAALGADYLHVAAEHFDAVLEPDQS